MTTEFEQQLSKLKLIEPTSDFEGNALMRLHRHRPSERSSTWNWALAACLVVSLGLNAWLLGVHGGHDTDTAAFPNSARLEVHYEFAAGAKGTPEEIIVEL